MCPRGPERGTNGLVGCVWWWYCVDGRLTPGSWEVPWVEAGWFPPGLEGGVLNLGSETPWESLELVTDMGPHSPLMLALPQAGCVCVGSWGCTVHVDRPRSVFASEVRCLGLKTLPPTGNL